MKPSNESATTQGKTKENKNYEMSYLDSEITVLEVCLLIW